MINYYRSCSTLKEVFEACYKWFGNHPERWCQYSDAISASGLPHDWSSVGDKARCATGQMVFVSKSYILFEKALTRFKDVVTKGEYVQSWNDKDFRTHADIVQAFVDLIEYEIENETKCA